jgi:hypothetical protein
VSLQSTEIVWRCRFPCLGVVFCRFEGSRRLLDVREVAGEIGLGSRGSQRQLEVRRPTGNRESRISDM